MENHFEFKLFAQKLTSISSEVIKKHFRTKFTIDTKYDDSPVTIADRKSEELMREAILKEFPNHGIIGEEFGEHNKTAEYLWVIDPIDGTKSFICGTLNFGTLIALLKNGEPIFGIFNQPILNEYLIGDNQSAMLNGEKVSMRICNKLSGAVLLTTDYLSVEKYQNIRKFDRLIHKVKIFREWGNCYGYYLLAAGIADIMIDPIMSFWDIAALVPIIKGAGGMITDYNGNNPMKGNSIIAASTFIHSEVIKELND